MQNFMTFGSTYILNSSIKLKHEFGDRAKETSISGKIINKMLLKDNTV
jgi:hypothetical protein